ncbi:LytTR family DNA-binding domain-containing protein [Pedobacter sp. Hv1]|uniref:LytR/AlgR family response regulator transcription factor n=1 Tax=Pedobacter sp. Hv1 TaxID=1740090 RepID=UPI0006D8A505|nr:LytTR family DNA-binding domain-containing protein [Pedobacter sp. Hv1]KQC00124.1 two-component system response regulator [Pedobacter sp. Hv1]
MNCLIVDDQEIFRTVLKRLLDLDTTLTLVGECADAFEAHQQIMSQQIDLIFLDIKMPGMSGIELAKILGDQHPLIIFTTSVNGYAAEAFELNVVDFLLKPISAARLLKAIEKAKEIIKSKGLTLNDQINEFAFIRDSNVVRRLKIKDIQYFEATGDYVKISMVDREYSIHSSLKNIEQKLPQDTFLRVHRSFIINVSKIDTVEGKTLVINKHLISVSDAYRADLNKKMQFL